MAQWCELSGVTKVRAARSAADDAEIAAWAALLSAVPRTIEGLLAVIDYRMAREALNGTVLLDDDGWAFVSKIRDTLSGSLLHS